MNPCTCGGKAVLRGPGGIAQHLDHSGIQPLFSVVCSRSGSRTRRCSRRTGLHPSKAEAVREWDGTIVVSSPVPAGTKECV